MNYSCYRDSFGLLKSSGIRFRMASFRFSPCLMRKRVQKILAGKNCRTQKVHLEITLSKIRLDIYMIKGKKYMKRK